MAFELKRKEKDLMDKLEEFSRRFENMKNVQENAYKIAELIPDILKIHTKMNQQYTFIKDAGGKAVDMFIKQQRKERTKKHDHFQRSQEW